MNYHNLSKLLKNGSVAASLINFDFTHLQVSCTFSCYDELEPDNLSIISQQLGVFRTNCIDNLDRTNAVQTLFSRQVLHQMLRRVKISLSNNNKYDNTYNYSIGVSPDEVSAFAKGFDSIFERVFRNMWAENGDAISLSYSGTPAQKGDYTRIGQRTIYGVINDIYIAAKRYYLGNFRDGYKQDCNDYFLAEVDPYKLIQRKNQIYVTLIIPAMILMSIIVFYLIEKMLKSYSNHHLKGGVLLPIVIDILIFIISLIICLKATIVSFKPYLYDKPSN